MARLKLPWDGLFSTKPSPESLGFKNELMDRGAIKGLTSELYRNLSNQDTARALDQIKEIGFYYATKSGITIAINDIQVSRTQAEYPRIGRPEGG